jgi:hypothetical protein
MSVLVDLDVTTGHGFWFAYWDLEYVGQATAMSYQIGMNGQKNGVAKVG